MLASRHCPLGPLQLSLGSRSWERTPQTPGSGPHAQMCHHKASKQVRAQGSHALAPRPPHRLRGSQHRKPGSEPPPTRDTSKGQTQLWLPEGHWTTKAGEGLPSWDGADEETP